MINLSIKKLLTYGLEHNIVNPTDIAFIRNRIMEILQVSYYKEPEEEVKNPELIQVLEEIDDYAVNNKLIENTQAARDLFDTKLMAALMPMPHEVVDNFKKLYRISAKKAAGWYYKFCQDTNFIRRNRISKDTHWAIPSKYGRLELLISVSKPEYDPKELKENQKSEHDTYPKCRLCAENMGYAGRTDYPALQNMRTIPITLNKETWYFNYSPYRYFNEHFIASNSEHKPLKINNQLFMKMFELLNMFPQYFVGANADLPIVGGSVISHEHIIGGGYDFAINRADVQKRFTIKRFEDVQSGILNWPVSSIRLKHTDYKWLCHCAEHILKTWQSYTDEDSNIYDFSGGVPHNSITSVIRKTGDIYEMDLILRNNRTTEEYPFGVFHINHEQHHIKKENLGLVEVMGLAVLPARLEEELKCVAQKILNGEDLREDETTAKHADWVDNFILEYDDISDDNITEILQNEVGKEYLKMLESAAVFKQDEQGQEAFDKFINSL